MRIIGSGYDGDLNLTSVTVEEDGREYRFEMPRWISVEEKLPEDEKDVAVIVKLRKGNWMYLTAFRLPCGGWWINRGAGLDYAEVTHWMPLPEPPKEE